MSFTFADASELSFDGTQYLKIDIPEGSKTQAEDVQLRFRTPRPGGLLLATTTDKATTFLALGLEGGRLKIVINLGNKNKVFYFLFIYLTVHNHYFLSE